MSDAATGPTGPTEPTRPIPRAQDPAAPEDTTAKVDRAADQAEDAIERTEHRAESRIAGARDAATAKVRETRDQAKDKIRETEAKVRTQVAGVERTVDQVKGGLSDPTPASSVEQAVDQASELRRAIDRDLDALQAKLPPSDELQEKAKTYGGAALGALALTGAAVLGLKQRGEHKRIEREARAHAQAIARYLPQASDEPRAPASDGGGKGGLVLLVMVAAAVGAALFKRQRDAQADEDLWGPA